ncbi:MAG: hypothetical protein COC23_08705 [Hyphomicrobiales bacterium]|nr:MAG: hypothetical protein COC23_08705 [Hyphomicrobiales bacterium]
MDLSGTLRVHDGPPAVTLAKLQARVEAELGVTASIGLSYNKFLAKIPKIGGAVARHFWTHECFIIKPGRERFTRQLVDRHEIKSKRWPAILAFGLQPFIQLNLSDPHIGFGAVTIAQCHQRIWFLGTS